MEVLEEILLLVMHMVDMVVEQEHTLITLVEVLVEDILVVELLIMEMVILVEVEVLTMLDLTKRQQLVYSQEMVK